MKEPPEVDWLEAANFTGQSTLGGLTGYVNRWYRKGPPGYVGSLMDYVARGYSPALGRFISADTIVPGAENPQAFNRYAYVLGNPLAYVDPSGHMEQDFGGGPASLRKLIDMYYSGYFDGCYMVSCQDMAASIWFRQHSDYSLGNDPELQPGEAGGWVTLGYLDNKMRSSQEVTFDDLSAWAKESMATWFDTGGAFGYMGGVVSDIQLNGGTAPSFGGAQQQACSFAPDTKVTTDGGPVSIAGVVTGTRVLAWDETTNATGYYPVTNVWVHSDPVLVVLIIDSETITTTPEHPFYTPMHGWLPAAELWVGAGLRRSDGGVGTVESTTTLTRTERMWNLSVATAHTYYVGVGGWLVHNAGGCPIVNKGKAGVARARQEIESDGGTWLADEITFKTPSGRTTRFDGAYLDSKGKTWLLEVKNGLTAKLTVNQQASHPEVAQGRSTPVGARAELAGYEPYEQVGPQRIHYINYR
ncbi:MAG: polymorphic toxin-type HINT domain-containing protein [Thermoflexales bacterium]